MAVNDLILLRKGTSAQWSDTNPTLASGEPGYDLTNKKLKIGDGTTAWNALSYEGQLYPVFSGSVGINTDNPQATLDIFGTTNNSSIQLGNATSTESYFTILSDAGAVYLAHYGGLNYGSTILEALLDASGQSASFLIGTNTQHNLGLFVNASELVTLQASNNRVGIGTTTPSALLHVNGTGLFSSGVTISNQTSNTIAGFDANKNIISLSTSTYPSLTELSYIKNTTSAVQTQLNNKSSITHTHGNITNSGAIGSTANLPLITTTDGLITAGSFGSTANTFCQGNDSRLSDTRTPTDNTVSTAKIINSNVTYAKIQNVSATDRILGRSSAGSGVIEEITCTSFARSLLDDADSSATRSTLGISKTIAFFTASDNQPPASSGASIDTRNSFLILDFDAATTEYGYFAGLIPESTDLSSGLDVRLNWSATSATSGNCVWESTFFKMPFSLDTFPPSSTAITGAFTTSVTGGSQSVATLTHTSGQINSLTAGDFFYLRIARLGASASDTMTGDAELIGLEVRTKA